MSEVSLTLAEASRIIRESMRDKSYRATPIGEDVGRFMRYMRGAEMAPTSRKEYESILHKFAIDHADLRLSDFAPPVGVERLEEFIDQRWGESAPGTRRKVTAILSSFFTWAYERGNVAANPMPLIKRPRRRQIDRRAHSRHEVLEIVKAQTTLRDRVGVLLLAKLALRKSEVRFLRIRDFDLDDGLVRLKQKGGDVVHHPFAEFDDLVWALAEHITLDGRRLEEYLLYPRWERVLATGELVFQREDRHRPLSDRGMHEWWSRALRRAGVKHFPMHELRHTAITEYHRANRDLELTRRFARHASAATTSEVYMHLDQQDLEAGMRLANERWKEAER